MSSIEYVGLLLISCSGAYFALRFALSTSRSVGSRDVARRSRRLHDAVAGGNGDRAAGLLHATVDFDRRDERDDTVLMVAVRNNDPEMVRLLLKKGADLFAENRKRQNAYDIAARLNVADGTVGYYTGMLRLLESRKDVPVRLLLKACRNGDVQRVRHALAIGAAVDARDYFVHRRDLHKGDTALMIAAGHGHLEIVRVLVEHGAEINFTCGWDGRPSTALEVAMARGRHDIVEFLMEHSVTRQATRSLPELAWRVEKALLGMLDRLQVVSPRPPGGRATVREIAAVLHEYQCAELLTAPDQCDGTRLTILLREVTVDEDGAHKLHSRWLEIQRTGASEYVANEYVTLRALPTP